MKALVLFYLDRSSGPKLNVFVVPVLDSSEQHCKGRSREREWDLDAGDLMCVGVERRVDRRRVHHHHIYALPVPPPGRQDRAWHDVGHAHGMMPDPHLASQAQVSPSIRTPGLDTASQACKRLAAHATSRQGIAEHARAESNLVAHFSSD
eukprot:3607022-Rhodomonas_salina.1